MRTEEILVSLILNPEQSNLEQNLSPPSSICNSYRHAARRGLRAASYRCHFNKLSSLRQGNLDHNNRAELQGLTLPIKEIPGPHASISHSILRLLTVLFCFFLLALDVVMQTWKPRALGMYAIGRTARSRGEIIATNKSEIDVDGNNKVAKN